MRSVAQLRRKLKYSVTLSAVYDFTRARCVGQAALLLTVLVSWPAEGQPTQSPAPAPLALPSATPSESTLPRPTVDAPPTLSAPMKAGLTRRDVVKRAIEKGPSQRTRAAEREAAQARVDQATAAFLPRFKFSATYRRVSPLEVPLGNAAIVGAYTEGPLFVGPSPAAGSPNLIVDSAGQPIGAKRFTIKSIESQYELKAELGIPISDLLFRMNKTIGSAKEATAAAASMEQAERQKLAMDATLAYYNFVRAHSSVEVSRRALERTKASLEDVQATTRAGVTTQTDQLRVDALVASTELTVAEAERMESLSRRQLQIMLDDDSLNPEVGEDPNASPASSHQATVPEVTQKALSNRAELKALRQAVNATEQKRSSIQVARYPRLDGFGQVLEGRPNNNITIPQDAWKTTWAVGVTLSYSPNDTVANGAIGAEARADHERVKSELETAERNIRLQAASAVYDLTKARTTIDAAKRGQQAATKAYQSARALYRAGEATTTDILDAETRLLSAELQLVYAELDLATAEAKLNYATGQDLF